ncbi:DNA-binding transcriptional MerR regulator [Paenibacillus mucilaginosus]|uniref:DUF2325 domain-containing protein n=1 Tax=Paenibacillus mucilaginosus TaxID=61624 RepID=UPI003D1CA5F8
MNKVNFDQMGVKWISEERKAAVALITEYVNSSLSGDLKEEDHSPAYRQHITDAADRAWAASKFRLKDIFQLYHVLMLMETISLDALKLMIGNFRIPLTPKDQKRGRRGIMERFMRKYHSIHIRDQIKLDFSMAYGSVIHRVEAGEQPKEIGIDEDTALWIITCLLENQELEQAFFEKHFLYYAHINRMMLALYDQIEFDALMEKPSALSSGSLDMKRVMKQNEVLQNQIERKEQMMADLQNNIKKLQHVETQLKKEIDELYQDALAEIEGLKAQLAQMRENHQAEIEKLEAAFDDEREQLLAQIREVKYSKQERRPDLSGQIICVVGGNRERYYREIIERFNGKIRFVPEDKHAMLRPSIAGSDVVFYLTTLTSHSYYSAAMESCKEWGIPLIYVNGKGTSMFEKLLMEYAEKGAVQNGRSA